MEVTALIQMCALMLAFSAYLYSRRKKVETKSNVLSFRTYHRIEWLRKRRAAKAYKRTIK